MKRNNLLRLINIVLFSAVISTVGCKENKKEKDYNLTTEEITRLNESNEQITGTVVGEAYFGGGLEKIDGVFKTGIVSQAYSNPTVVPGKSLYIIAIDLDEGPVIALNVLDEWRKPKEMAEALFSKEDRISFRKGNLWKYTSNWREDPVFIKEDTNETGFYREGDLYVTRNISAIKRLSKED